MHNRTKYGSGCRARHAPSCTGRAGHSKTITPTHLEFVDIAGLVRGASKGEGLGNQFLANIREVDAIAHVLRCFDDNEIAHVDGDVDPIRDAATVETELMLADIDSLERRMTALVKKSAAATKEAKSDLVLMEKLFAHLSEGKPARSTTDLTREELMRLPLLQLLTAKPVLYVCNVSESDASTGNAHCKLIADKAVTEGAAHVIVSAAIESEIAQLDEVDKIGFLCELGLKEPGLARLIRALRSARPCNLLHCRSLRKPALGRLPPAPAHPRLQALSTPISNGVSLGQKPSLTMIILPVKAKLAPKRLENYVSKVATIK